jgi:hypothetical protein
MRRHLSEKRTDDFVRRIEKNLIPVLDEIILDKERLQCHCGLQTPQPKFSGDWGPGSKVNSLTQLSTNQDLWMGCGSICFSYAVQVELSYRFRKYLDKNRKGRESFINAIVSSVAF